MNKDLKQVEKELEQTIFLLLCVRMNDNPLAVLGNCLSTLQSHAYCCAEERYKKKTQLLSQMMQKTLNLYK